MRLTVILAALCAVLSASNAEARSKHGHHYRSVAVFSDLYGAAGCSDPVMRPCQTVEKRALQQKRIFQAKSQHPSPSLRRVMAEGAGRVVGGRPAGCPHAFCGCGASLYLFGKIVPALNLAANWLRFPRAEPAPGMVAARKHHVFVLVRHIRGQVWLAHDSNSGRHRTRVHPRSIAGFVIVDPRAGA